MNSQENRQHRILGDGLLVGLEVLLDRGVPLIDELAEFIDQRGGPSLASILDDLRERATAPVPAGSRHAAPSQRDITSEILRYRSNVERPTTAILREYKAAHPSAVRKVALGGRDAEVLTALEPDLSGLSEAPAVSSLALRVSPELSADAAHKYGGGDFLAGAHHNILAMYVGPYRPGMPSPGFYLIYDAWANLLAAVPQLPRSSISWFSHRAIGSGAAVLRHAPPSDYILAELLTRNDSRGQPTNNATLCMWCSSGPIAHRWIQKEVVLPLPTAHEAHIFIADTVFAVGNTSLCWVDLLMGILICEDMLAPDLVFCFIPLPVPQHTTLYPPYGRGRPEDFRSVSCNVKLLSSSHTIKFVSLDGYLEGRPANQLMLTKWSLSLSDPVSKSVWSKEYSFSLGRMSLPDQHFTSSDPSHVKPPGPQVPNLGSSRVGEHHANMLQIKMMSPTYI
ncbi:hypothetical protein C2845_PM16G15990 [Panicum miliaceum]|uniref:DUF1618 domain-containing protein n=1 Tax=Panicum miliaceum TaxID=4540 RepID=A0A3L6PS46_PANMI|nr:hypothetical protein C2845_PM16G15990 [Panicum miliaceum]